MTSPQGDSTGIFAVTHGQPISEIADQAPWGWGNKLSAELNVRGSARRGGTSGGAGLPAAAAEAPGSSRSRAVCTRFPQVGVPLFRPGPHSGYLRASLCRCFGAG